MESKRDRTVATAVITGVVTLLLGLCLGATAGGLIGYVAGREAGRQASPSVVAPRSDRNNVTPIAPRRTATPRSGATPRAGAPDNGTRVESIVPGSPAGVAGLRIGDFITAIDNMPVDQNHPLADALLQYKPGDEVTIGYTRLGQSQTTKVRLGARTDDASKPYLGVRFADPSATPTPRP